MKMSDVIILLKNGIIDHGDLDIGLLEPNLLFRDDIVLKLIKLNSGRIVCTMVRKDIGDIIPKANEKPKQKLRIVK